MTLKIESEGKGGDKPIDRAHGGHMRARGIYPRLGDQSPQMTLLNQKSFLTKFLGTNLTTCTINGTFLNVGTGIQNVQYVIF